MNEICVVVNQEPGKVTWNFEEIKKRLQEELKIYQNTAYTDDTIKTAKGDVADLRKLAAAIEDRRKEVKEKCLEPYALIEAQAKELVALIDDPINAINEQVKDYEKRRKEKVRADILTYYQQNSSGIPEQIKEKVYQSIYDTRWENATATKKSWKEGIDKGIADVAGAIDTIKSFKSEFENDMLVLYYETLNLQAAIRKMNELNVQKERILEQERKRKEAEEAEQKRQEEKKRRQEETAGSNDSEGIQGTSPQAPGESRPMAYYGLEHGENVTGRDVANPTAGTNRNSGLAGGQTYYSDRTEIIGQQTDSETRACPDKVARTVRISGTEEQIDKILNFIRYTGAEYEEV